MGEMTRIHSIDIMRPRPSVQFSFQIFNAARQLSHIEAAPDKSGLVLPVYWVGLKRYLVIIHGAGVSSASASEVVQSVSCRILTVSRRSFEPLISYLMRVNSDSIMH